MQIEPEFHHKHIGWVDYAKSWAIFSVVLLHTECFLPLTQILLSFAVPLFFFISGFLFSRQRNPRFRPFLYKRFRQLIIPYLWINILAYIIWIIWLRHYGAAAVDSLSWYQPIIGTALGIPRFLAHDLPVWALLSFFVIEIIYYLLPTRKNSYILLIASASFLIASVIYYRLSKEWIDLPFALTPSFLGLAFYSIGNFIALNQKRFQFLVQPSTMLFLGGLTLLIIGYYFQPSEIYMTRNIGSPILYLISAIGGIVMSIQLSVRGDNLFHDNKLIRLISRGTLIICGFHILAFSFIKGIAYFGFGIAPELLTSGIFRGILLAMIAILLCLPIILIIEKYFRPLVDK